MVVSMTDGTLRVVSCDGYFPIGMMDGSQAQFDISTEFGETPTPPDKVPLYWIDQIPEGPSGYSSIDSRLAFVYYYWETDDGHASWECDIFRNDVRLNDMSPLASSGSISISLDLIST